jgi:hypothetical protein
LERWDVRAAIDLEVKAKVAATTTATLMLDLTH